jgi:hypothetical protein
MAETTSPTCNRFDKHDEGHKHVRFFIQPTTINTGNDSKRIKQEAKFITPEKKKTNISSATGQWIASRLKYCSPKPNPLYRNTDLKLDYHFQQAYYQKAWDSKTTFQSVVE